MTTSNLQEQEGYQTEYIMHAVPDGIIFEDRLRINTEFVLREPKRNLSMNKFIRENDDNTSDYIDLAVFILYKVFKNNKEEQYLSRFLYNFADYLIYKSSCFGEVRDFIDISVLADNIHMDYYYIDVIYLKEIVYRLWLGDYLSFYQ